MSAKENTNDLNVAFFGNFNRFTMGIPIVMGLAMWQWVSKNDRIFDYLLGGQKSYRSKIPITYWAVKKMGEEFL